MGTNMHGGLFSLIHPHTKLYEKKKKESFISKATGVNSDRLSKRLPNTRPIISQAKRPSFEITRARLRPLCV